MSQSSKNPAANRAFAEILEIVFNSIECSESNRINQPAFAKFSKKCSRHNNWSVCQGINQIRIWLCPLDGIFLPSCVEEFGLITRPVDQIAAFTAQDQTPIPSWRSIGSIVAEMRLCGSTYLCPAGAAQFPPNCETTDRLGRAILAGLPTLPEIMGGVS